MKTSNIILLIEFFCFFCFSAMEIPCVFLRNKIPCVFGCSSVHGSFVQFVFYRLGS